MNRPRLCAIVPTFDPGSQVTRCIESLADQVDQIIVVDDGSKPRFKPMPCDLDSRSVTLFDSDTNHGVAAALNRGVLWALSHDFMWAITVDQDTIVGPDLVARLFAALDASPDADRVAMVGPRLVHPESRARAPSDSRAYRQVSQLVASGSLVRIDALRDVGFFDESFIIDRVDFDICARLRGVGYLLLEAPQAELRHAPGDTQQVHLLGRVFRRQTHNYKRRYYMARNTIWLVRRYALRDPIWVLRRVTVLGIQLAAIALFENDKWRKLDASLGGLLDGLRGRSGSRYPDMRVGPQK